MSSVCPMNLWAFPTCMKEFGALKLRLPGSRKLENADELIDIYIILANVMFTHHPYMYWKWGIVWCSNAESYHGNIHHLLSCMVLYNVVSSEFLYCMLILFYVHCLSRAPLKTLSMHLPVILISNKVCTILWRFYFKNHDYDKQWIDK